MQKNESRGRSSGDMTPSPYLKGAGVGLQFALTFLAMGALGWWLDGWLGVSPLFLILGILVGAAGGMYSLVRQLDPKSLHPNSPHANPPTPPTSSSPESASSPESTRASAPRLSDLPRD